MPREWVCDMGVEPKIGIKKHKMDGENHGKPYEQMDDLGGKPTIFGNTHMLTLSMSHLDIAVYWW